MESDSPQYQVNGAQTHPGFTNHSALPDSALQDEANQSCTNGKLEFPPGEQVMYPQFGLGIIEGVSEKRVGEETQRFYRLAFPWRKMEILVPVPRAAENGLRHIMSEVEARTLIHYLASQQEPPRPQQWHRWRKNTQEQLKSGTPKETANIHRHLHCLQYKKSLSFTERKILLQVEQILVSEIAAACTISTEAAHTLLNACYSGANGSGHAASSNGVAPANHSTTPDIKEALASAG